MKKRNITNMALLLFTITQANILVIPIISACTIFTATQDGTTFFAGNEDQRPNDAYFIVDTSGTYEVAYIATPWEQWPMVMQTGINENGLCFDANWIPTEILNPHPERTDPGEWPVTYMMKEAATVDQVLDLAFTFNWGNSMAYQVHFADESGDAVILHPGADGELTYTRKQPLASHIVSTNFNLRRLETGEYECQRYDTANEMLLDLEPGEPLTVEDLASVLDATHQEGEFSTIYSTIFDVGERQIWLYFDHRFDDPVVIDLYTELQKGDQQIHLDQFDPSYYGDNAWYNNKGVLGLILLVVIVAFNLWVRGNRIAS
jgi:hypothetical protein